MLERARLSRSFGALPVSSLISASSAFLVTRGFFTTFSLSKILSKAGIDVIDCSSGGITGRPRFAANDDGSVLKSNLDRGLGFQVPYAYEIKKNSTIKKK